MSTNAGGALISKQVIFWYLMLLGIWSCREELPRNWTSMTKDLPAKISYNFHVKPILSDRCFACHGPDEDKREADLRLDDPASAFSALVEHPGKVAIYPGSLDRSEVYHRLTTTDPELVMPPASFKVKIEEREKAILAKWILQGANYEDHWSFQPLQPVSVPRVNSESNWAINEIDRFILAKMEEHDLQPSPQADRETLVRRLSFDLTGLPPRSSPIAPELSPEDQDAYENYVDQLLADPAYGERMAAHWMDVARYADSDGYLDDKHREFSPWRDWVIHSFNANMPYDEFVTWQIAGDLLPNPSQHQILATAFNRLHKKNSEAGIVFEEYRVEYVADRTHTLGKAFLGLSVECARCHDHKYDPISQEDYYRLFGFFNSTHEIGTPVYGPDQTPGPALLLTTGEQEKMIDFIDRKIEEQGVDLEMAKLEANDQFHSWKTNLGSSPDHLLASRTSARVALHDFDHLMKTGDKTYTSRNLADHTKKATLTEPLLKKGVKGDGFFVTDYNTITLGEKVGWFDRTDPFSVELWLYPEHTYNDVGIFNHCEDIRLGYKGFSLHLERNKLRFIMAHSWPQNALEVVSLDSLPVQKWTHVAVTYDGSSQAKGIRLYMNGREVERENRADNLYKGILFEPNIHTYGFSGFRLGYRDKIITFKDGGVDELQIFSSELSPLEILYGFDPEKAKDQFYTNVEDAKGHFVDRVDSAVNERRDRLRASRVELNNLVNEIDEIMVLGDLPQPRPTYVLERGLYDAPGKRVEPGTPDAIHTYAPEYPRNRLGLTQWLFDRKNPLTARVFVNRIWQMHFGVGLVKTSDDFGAQGSLPTHPKLLDWLANWFVESDWDIKALHRLIVCSATYRQSSKVSERHLRSDPENMWLARAPSPRLDAEMIRDQALALSGLLVDTVGGPSVYPYQPAGLWDELSNKSWRYPYLQKPGPGLYRRSLYSVYKRTAPPPSMLIFDVPDRSTCTVKRTTTSTPLQALVLLNDPQFVEASRALAANILANHSSAQDLVRATFFYILGRVPTQMELASLLDFYQSERDRLQKDSKSALAYLSVGEHTVEYPTDAAALAALSLTASSIFNTVEAQTRR